MSYNPIVQWLRSTIFLFNLDIVKKTYEESYRLLPIDVQENIKENYLHDIWHSIDLLLCMMPYRDIQYGPKGKGPGGKKLRRRMKLSWVAYNINAIQKLLDNWGSLEKELWDWYYSVGHQYRSEDKFKEFTGFLQNYLQTTIAELSVLYVYLYNDRPVMPLGFMQHLVTMGPSAPTLGDMIDIETLTFIEVKSNRARVKEFKKDLLSLTINTRLPAAIAVPRYRVNKNTSQIDENGIVVELYTLSSVPGKVWIEHVEEKNLEADIENELKPLMQNITLLRKNAKNYLQEKREKEEGKNSG
jgi:hypothetical protein